MLRTATLLKMKLWHRCFSVNFAKFLRTPFVTEHLSEDYLESNHTGNSICLTCRQTARCSIPIRGRDISTLKRQSAEFSEDVAGTPFFKNNQPLEGNRERDWCIAFYLGVSDIKDYIVADYLQCLIKTLENNEWVLPKIEDI